MPSVWLIRPGEGTIRSTKTALNSPVDLSLSVRGEAPVLSASIVDGGAAPGDDLCRQGRSASFTFHVSIGSERAG